MDTTLNFRDKIIAVDFDNTLTLSSTYPITGKLNMNVVNKVKELKKSNVIILWTCREGEELQEAINLCSNVGLYFDFINQNADGSLSRKIKADYYLDDKAINIKDFL